MSEDLYFEALSHFKNGEYEVALALLKKSGNNLSLKEKKLLEECKKLITDKYYYIIKEDIKQGEILKACNKKAEYERIYNFDSRIANIEIPQNDDSSDEYSYKKMNIFEKFFHSTAFYIVIIALAIGAIIILLTCLKNKEQNSTDYTYTNNTETTDSTEYAVETETEDENGNDEFELTQIKEQRGNFKVTIEWPVSMSGIDDISQLQKCIIKDVFHSDCDNINECIEQYLDECEEDAKQQDYEINGCMSVKFQQRQNDLYIFELHDFADYGGAGAAVMLHDKYIYFDKELGRELDINDITNYPEELLDILNYKISSDKRYLSKADKIPNNFILTNSGITFIFPQYAIGCGADGEVQISLTYDELDNVLSETIKRAIGNEFKEKWEKFVYSGTMTDNSGTYPIEMSFERHGHNLRNCVYKNVNQNISIPMKCRLIIDTWVFSGKDGKKDFIMEINLYDLCGEAYVGNKRLKVQF